MAVKGNGEIANEADGTRLDTNELQTLINRNFKQYFVVHTNIKVSLFEVSEKAKQDLFIVSSQTRSIFLADVICPVRAALPGRHF